MHSLKMGIPLSCFPFVAFSILLTRINDPLCFFDNAAFIDFARDKFVQNHLCGSIFYLFDPCSFVRQVCWYFNGPKYREFYFFAVECWDGSDEEPIVFHGHTMTSQIPLRSVLRTIKEHAFVASA